ncbi:unnamed protein product [Brugia pahangi]|uniref:DM domain-containing protein n=1 Tax=Brugia pahangi TaxID=6280 RepID=A0A0N4TZH8_BRUPA|nr:unnamed protein product [Brugia pahangi]
MPSRTLFCRKCEGHGRQIVLKGNVGPYNDCHCKTVIVIPTFRNYTTISITHLVLKSVQFQNGNIRLRVYPKFIDVRQNAIYRFDETMLNPEMAFMVQEYGCSQNTISNISNASIPICQQHEYSRSKLQNYISEQFNSSWQGQGKNSDLFLNQFENRCMPEFVAMILNQCANSNLSNSPVHI